MTLILGRGIVYDGFSGSQKLCNSFMNFLYQVLLRKQGYLGWKMWPRYLLGFGTEVFVRHRLSIKINKIKRRLDQITAVQKEYKIEHIPFVPLTSSTTAFAAWYATICRILFFCYTHMSPPHPNPKNKRNDVLGIDMIYTHKFYNCI